MVQQGDLSGAKGDERARQEQVPVVCGGQFRSAGTGAHPCTQIHTYKHPQLQSDPETSGRLQHRILAMGLTTFGEPCCPGYTVTCVT